MKRQSFTMVELALLLGVIAAFLVIITAIFGMYTVDGVREYARRSNCSGNLKSMGVALLMYSGDYSGYFPPTPDGNSIEPLNTASYLNDSKVYHCPSSSSGRQTAADSDFWYVGETLRDDNQQANTQRLIFDMYNNHPDNKWMNVLFIDGHVGGDIPGTNLPFKNDDAVIRAPGGYEH